MEIGKCLGLAVKYFDLNDSLHNREPREISL